MVGMVGDSVNRRIMYDLAAAGNLTLQYLQNMQTLRSNPYLQGCPLTEDSLLLLATRILLQSNC